MKRQMRFNKSVFSIFFAAVLTLPGTIIALSHIELSPPVISLITGIAILSAAFMLLWACDAAQADISQCLALATVALIAVLPEYAVDMYFTWQAGKYPESEYAHYAIANMTGANRLIIGVAWTAVVLIFWLRTRRAVVLEKDRRLEIKFLAVATLYAFVIPLKGSLLWYDGLVFAGLYIWYIILAGKRPRGECDAEGPGLYLINLPTVTRRVSVILMFLFAAGAIIANAENFSEGLVGTGKLFGIDEFLLVQWLAPLASESPEFVVAIMFALRGQASLALGSLVAAKLNQWTLLVGMIPGVYALSSGQLAHGLPMSVFQHEEILLTAAQSMLAVIMLCVLRLTIGQALFLFVLFMGQLLSPMLVDGLLGGAVFGIRGDQMHVLFSFVYFSAALMLIIDHPQRLGYLWPWHTDDWDPLSGGSMCSTCGTAVRAESDHDELTENGFAVPREHLESETVEIHRK